MSNYFESFIQLIEERPELFTEEDRDSLRRQQWSDDRDYIDDEIIKWAKSRPSLYQALTTPDVSHISSEKIGGDGNKNPPIRKPINEAGYRLWIDNTIDRCFSDSKNQETSTVANKAE